MLHCLNFAETGVQPDEDDIVIVERRRAQEGQREVTAKRFRRRGKQVILAPDSTDKKWRPIIFDPQHASENIDVAVISVVLGVYQPLRRRR